MPVQRHHVHDASHAFLRSEVLDYGPAMEREDPWTVCGLLGASLGFDLFGLMNNGECHLRSSPLSAGRAKFLDSRAERQIPED